MPDILLQPLPWYVAGPLIGLTVPALLLLANRQLGISSSLRHACAACMPIKPEFFQYNWRDHAWNLVFVLGVFLGGVLGVQYFGANGQIDLNPATVADLQALGVNDFSSYLPADLFGWGNLGTANGLLMMVFGGFLVGFGVRYAGGCTSGHAIMGLSYFQAPSLAASMAFFAGGLFMTHVLFPLIF
jgi:Predicted transporter component